MGQPYLPPWEPIADWLAQLSNVSCDEEHEDTREATTATQKEVRDRYEKTAKAIAYDISMAQHDLAERTAEEMKRQVPNVDPSDLSDDTGVSLAAEVDE